MPTPDDTSPSGAIMSKNKLGHTTLKNPKDFEFFYNKYAKQMYRLCYHYSEDIETSKEIVQDIFKSIWERKNELVIETSIESYLMRAAKLKVFQHARDLANHTKHLECILKNTSKSNNCAENQVLYNSLSEQVNLLIDKLPSRCKEVYGLSREKGISNKQIASTLLISEKTVEKHLSKALRFLRNNLKEYQS